mmetsp:Transcript_50404/g.133928  ORF Transcript_50404/g.133928 Transcript_50404/m.133928 type:complete len:100 (-) Transcript_50404:1061-1360(-)
MPNSECPCVRAHVTHMPRLTDAARNNQTVSRCERIYARGAVVSPHKSELGNASALVGTAKRTTEYLAAKHEELLQNTKLATTCANSSEAREATEYAAKH